MDRSKLLKVLKDEAGINPWEDLERDKDGYLALLDTLERLEPGSSINNYNRLLVKLVTDPDGFVLEDPEVFQYVCEKNPILALRHASEQWWDLNAESFNTACFKSPESALAYCPDLWYETSPQDFKAGWVKSQVRGTQRADELYANDNVNDFRLNCELRGGGAAGSVVWAKLDPGEHSKACYGNYERIFLHSPETALLWKETDREGFWSALEEYCDRLDVATRVGDRVEAPGMPESNWAGNEDHGLHKELLEMLLEERPDLLRKAIRGANLSYDPRRGRINALIENPEKWYEVDPEGYWEECRKEPAGAHAGVGRLSSKARTDLLNNLPDGPISSSQEELLELRDNLANKEDATWSFGNIISALNLAVWEYRKATTENERKISTKAINYLRGQAVKGEHSAAVASVLVRQVLENVDTDVLRVLLQDDGSLYARSFTVLVEKLEDPQASSFSLTEYCRGLVVHVKYVRDNSEKLLTSIKEKRVPFDENLGILLELTLSVPQSQELTTWILNTPGLPQGTMEWALARAGTINTTRANIRPAKRERQAPGIG
jgi:hypothetical protein